MENVYFINMFPDFVPPEELTVAFSQAAIVAADIDPQTRSVEVCLSSPKYISRRDLHQAEKDLEALYGLRSLRLVGTYPEDQMACMDTEDLMALFVEENSMCRGSLAGAKWEWTGPDLHIRLAANGKAVLDECTPAVTRKIGEMFSAPVKIHIQAGEALEGKALFSHMEKLRAAMIDELPKVTVSAPAKEQKQQTDAIFGKPFRGTVTPMNQLDLNTGTVIVEGRVFNIEHKELTKRNAWVVGFDVTDNTGSVRVSKFFEKKDAEPIIQGIKKDGVYKIQGKLDVDNYTGETVLRPYAIMAGTMEKRKDTAEGMKRVELHLHTSMSNMDALTNTKAAIKQAAAWGHRAIAITDHGCVQSFTDALHTVEAWGGGPKVAGTDDVIKIIYGCEGYYVNDVDDRIAVHGTQNMSFDQPFVAFDLETTGLDYREDKIIEIGAVLFQNGKELDRFQTFVSPGQKLRQEIVDLTGITDSMLADAPSIEQVLPQFLKFVGDRVLVAHNADFDCGFIRMACNEQGLPYTFTSVDTLILAQNLMTGMNRFKLNLVEDALSLP